MSASGSGVVPANGIRIAYETFGDRGARPLLMVMGLGAPMLTWHPDLCKPLAGHGFLVIRYDNRDVGRSTHDLPRPVWPALADAISALADRAEYPTPPT